MSVATVTLIAAVTSTLVGVPGEILLSLQITLIS